MQTRFFTVDLPLPAPPAWGPRSASSYLDELRRRLAGTPGCRVETVAQLDYRIDAAIKRFEYVTLRSHGLERFHRWLLVRAGIHGNEIAPCYSVLRHARRWFELAHGAGVGLVICPLDNPSGFEGATRYNAENDRGSAGNNDFLRYELAHGILVDDLGDGFVPGTGEPFDVVRCHWSSAPELGLALPQETRVLHDLLRTLPLASLGAVIDLHQDNYLSRPATYAFSGDETARYREVCAELRTFTEVLHSIEIEDPALRYAGYEKEVFPVGGCSSLLYEQIADPHGFVRHHDGSLGDLMFRIGVPHALTIETASVMPQEAVDRVCDIWIAHCIARLAAR